MALTADQEKFCVELRKMGRTREDILILFQDVFYCSPSMDAIVDVFKKHGLSKAKKEVFLPWMVEYIKKEYKGPNDVNRIAKHIGVTKSQLVNKVGYLGLNIPNEVSFIDKQIEDAKLSMARVYMLKKKIVIGSKVRVQYDKYNDFDSDKNHHKNKGKIADVEVVGVYPNFVNVLIDGFRSSYRYEDILEVL